MTLSQEKALLALMALTRSIDPATPHHYDDRLVVLEEIRDIKATLKRALEILVER